MLSRPLVLGFALVLTGCVAAPAQADPTDDYIAKALKLFDVPGLALVVIKDGKIVKASGYGFANREDKVAVTPDTAFKIGSVSKQFIATGIMLLVQDGRMRVDDPVSKYLPGTPASWASITIAHLLSHSSGLVRESPAFDPNKIISDADVVRALYPLALVFPPGSKSVYSNAGYFALADIIRIVSGQPWADFIRARVFAPLGMTATTTTSAKPKTAAMAIGYDGRNNVKRADDWPALRPSGAFVSTVTDMAKWYAALETSRPLSEASRQQMWSPAPLAGGAASQEGFGWHISGLAGRPMIWHGGGLPGFSAYCLRFGSERLAIVVLTNADDVDMGSIAANVALLHLPPK